jgi:hypothetical protein
MRISAAIAATPTLLLALTPAHAAVLYPTLPCRVFVDTDYTQIPDQCGTGWRSYPRRLFVRAARPSSHYCGPASERRPIRRSQ